MAPKLSFWLESNNVLNMSLDCLTILAFCEINVEVKIENCYRNNKKVDTTIYWAALLINKIELR